MDSLGITTIHYAIAGHYDSDHIGGLGDLVDLTGGNTGITENNKSISALITYGGFDFYVGSDLEGTGEKAVDDVVITDLARNVDILHVDHHGSDTYDISSAEFLGNMGPEVAIISVWNNSFGHPRENVVLRLQVVVEGDDQRIIRLHPGDVGGIGWAPEDMAYCHTANRHLYITTNGSRYTVDTVYRSGAMISPTRTSPTI